MSFVEQHIQPAGQAHDLVERRDAFGGIIERAVEQRAVIRFAGRVSW
jgi:hypothetical protein